MLSSIIFTALLGLVAPVLGTVNGNSTVRINALGDSITGSPGCWRALLWEQLQAAGVKNTQFVGTLIAQGCGFNYDGMNDGHGGALATGIVSADELPGWLAISRPDIVMMFLGTNDVWSGTRNTSVILGAYTTLVEQMRAQNPAMTVLVAQITPMAPTGCDSCAQDVIDLNAAIPAWAAGISTDVSSVSVVDCWDGYSDALDTADGVHPNDAGNTILANDWFAPLSSAIVSVGGQAPATTSTKLPTSTSSTLSTTVISTSSKPVTSTSTSSSSKASSTTTGVSPIYGQCGGQGWSGPTACASGSTCTYNNAWYSQCLPN